MMQTENGTRNLVYAAIGPSSLKNTATSNLAATFEFEDHHVEYAELSHKLHNDIFSKSSNVLVHTMRESQTNLDGKFSTMQIKPITFIHSIDIINLDVLLIQLRKEVTPKWYEFGVTAGVDQEILDNFARNCAQEDCIIEMLDYWLRNYTGRLTWMDVAKILRLIDLEQLAVDIESIYSTGDEYHVACR